MIDLVNVVFLASYSYFFLDLINSTLGKKLNWKKSIST